VEDLREWSAVSGAALATDSELGDERPILGATDGPFFEGPHGERFASPMSLVGSMSFPFYLTAMRRPDLGQDPRFLTPELRLCNLAALHRIVQEWIWTFGDMDALDAQLDEAKIATRQVRWPGQDPGPSVALRGAETSGALIQACDAGKAA
jgi:hypothetical protein